LTFSSAGFSSKTADGLMSLTDRIAAHRAANVLTDGRLSIPYAELPAELARFDLNARQSLGPLANGTVVLVGRNDLGTMIAVLSCLATGRSCYFWRPTNELAGTELSWDEMPEFCHAAVMARSLSATTATAIEYDFSIRAPTALTETRSASPYFYLGTSGTTSRPKLAAYTPERLIGNAENCVRRFQITANDRVLLPLPLAHMYGLGAAFLPAVLAGASVRVLGNVNLLTYLQAEREFDPTVVFLTPALAHQLVTARKHGRQYRLTAMGADRIDPESFARYEERHGCTVCVYGCTELGAVASGSPDDPFARRQNSSGRLLDHVRQVPPLGDSDSETVTLCFDHPFGMSGYADATGEPQLPADLYRDGMYLTRDVGELNEHGDLCVRGRRDDCVKRDGYLVAFCEVERALEQLPEIDRAIVMKGETTPRGIALVAFCVVVTGGDAAEIRRACVSILPGHAIPDHIIVLDQLPLLSTGKPDRHALHSLLHSQSEGMKGVP
jgi:acyl-coenzyme A synthetase/AMP-(fatty) acid ligase